MIIQFNTDKTINGDEKHRAYFIGLITEEFERFSDSITRIEVHLGDENGNKEGIGDIRCMLEARLKGRQPIAVTSHADTNDAAVSASIDKLKASLETILGKMRNF
jgi:hypothetical protein